MKPWLGVTMLLSAAVLFSINGIVSKIVLLGGFPTMALTQLRLTGGFLLLALVLLIFAPARLKITWREVPLLALYGVVGFSMVQWLYLVAIGRLPVSIALLLEFTAPIFVALWAKFVRKEPVRPILWFGLSTGLIGLMMVGQIWLGLTLDVVGVLAALGAAISLAVYFLIGERQVRNTRDPLSLTCWALGFSSLFWAIISPWWNFPVEQLTNHYSLLKTSATAPSWLLVLWIIVLGTIVPFALATGALVHISAPQASIIGMLEPVFISILGWLWLSESLTLVQILGGMILLVGVMLAERARRGGDTLAQEYPAGSGLSR